MQKSVSLSSAEVEFFGAMLAARDVVYLRDLLVDFDISVDSASSLWSDSGSAVKMAFDPVSFRNTKHIMRAAAQQDYWPSNWASNWQTGQ